MKSTENPVQNPLCASKEDVSNTPAGDTVLKRAVGESLTLQNAKFPGCNAEGFQVPRLHQRDGAVSPLESGIHMPSEHHIIRELLHSW